MNKLMTFIMIMCAVLYMNGSMGQTVTDIDGNVYNTVAIGTQQWITENLKTTKLNDGTDIPLVTDNTDWYNLTTPAYCWYNNDQATNGNTYGAMYNWYVVGTQKLCPTGWHVPSDSDWTVLVDYLGGTSVAGNKLKEAGTTHWIVNTGATNESGYTALPGGQRGAYGVFDLILGAGVWWGSTEYSTLNANSMSLLYSSGIIHYNGENKLGGWSVRCIEGNTYGINNQEKPLFKINVYPNPSDGYVTIETSRSQKTLLQIIDMHGKVVIEKQFTGTTEIELPSKGIYAVKISDGTNIVLEKLVIQ